MNEDSRPPDDIEPTARLPEKDVDRSMRVGPYRLRQKIGEGGMGEVWLAEQEVPIKRRVALKIIKRGMDSREVVARFEAERQALALMNHVNVAKVFDAGATERGRPYFVMEYVKGTPINEHCDRYRLSPRERLELFRQVCAGVQHAHQKAIIHRDLKPSNVLVTEEEGRRVPKIIDFGVAKAISQRLTEKTMFTELGVLIGTPEYMSPEQAQLTSEDVDTRTDVYSLGVILYELLVGALPFDPRQLRSEGFAGIRRKILEEEPLRPSTRLSELGEKARETARLRHVDLPALRRQLLGDLDWITMRAMEKDRSRRYGSPSELAEDLRRFLANEPVTARPPSGWYRAQKFARRHRTGVLVAGAMVLVLAAFAFSMTLQAERIARERDRANLEAATATEVSDFLVSLFAVADPDEARGNSITAREILDEGAQRIEWELEGQPGLRSRLMEIMGQVYYALGLFEPARPLLEDALKTQTETFGPRSAEVANGLHALGMLEMVSGHHAQADSLFRAAVEIGEAELGPESPEVAATLNRLGELHRRQGDYDEAEAFYQRALAIQVAQLGEDHPTTAETVNNLSVLYWHLDRLDDAEREMRRSLRIREKTLRPNHPRVAENLNNLGTVNYMRQNYDRAEEYYLRALQIRESVYGPSHTEVAQTLYNLSQLYVKQGKYAEARRVLERTIAIYRDAFGDEHHLVAHCLHGIGLAWKGEGRLDEAERYLTDSIALREKSLGPDHLRVGVSLYELADVHLQQGRLEAAQAEVDRALEILERSVGSGHRHYRAAEAIRESVVRARRPEDRSGAP